MPCPLTDCRSTNEADALCQGHSRQLAAWLSDLWKFYKTAHDCLSPEVTGDGGGGRRGEITLGVSVAALSWINGNDIYLVLGGWERVVRDERRLTPAGLLPPVPGVTQEVARLIAFHHRHLDWIGAQAWADAYWQEVRGLHAEGMAAARAYVEKHTRLHCPAEVDGLPCGAFLTLRPDDPLETFACRRCGTEWSSLRLVAVAQADSTRPLWVDVETAAALLNKSRSQIWRVCQRLYGKGRKGLVNLHELRNFYAA